MERVSTPPPPCTHPGRRIWIYGLCVCVCVGPSVRGVGITLSSLYRVTAHTPQCGPSHILSEAPAPLVPSPRRRGDRR